MLGTSGGVPHERELHVRNVLGVRAVERVGEVLRVPRHWGAVSPEKGHLKGPRHRHGAEPDQSSGVVRVQMDHVEIVKEPMEHGAQNGQDVPIEHLGQVMELDHDDTETPQRGARDVEQHRPLSPFG